MPAAPPKIPMSDAQIEAKFLANATPVIGAERAQRAVEWVASLEKQTDVRELIALLALKRTSIKLNRVRHFIASRRARWM